MKRIRLDRRLNSVIMLHKLTHSGCRETDLFNECILEGLRSVGVLDQEEYEKLKHELNKELK